MHAPQCILKEKLDVYRKLDMICCISMAHVIQSLVYVGVDVAQYLLFVVFDEFICLFIVVIFLCFIKTLPFHIGLWVSSAPWILSTHFKDIFHVKGAWFWVKVLIFDKSVRRTSFAFYLFINYVEFFIMSIPNIDCISRSTLTQLLEYFVLIPLSTTNLI